MRTAKLNMDNGLIELVFEYDPTLVEVVRSLPDRHWDKSKKAWLVPNTGFHANMVIDTLTPFGFQIDPRLHMLKATKTKPRFILKRDGLYDFQSEAVDFLENVGGRALLADEQGLGKTIEALYWIAHREDISKTLVVCPASVIYKWKSEIEKWDAGATVSIIGRTVDPIEDTNYIIMSYAIMTRKVTELVDMVWDCIIFDECHKLKSSDAQRSRAAKNLNSKYLLALSGTPILNRPVEFYNILHMLNPTQWSSWWDYTHRYCGAKKTYWGLDVTGASNLDELSIRVASTMIRRLKKDVLTELPDITRTKVPVKVDAADINFAYRRLYDYIRENGHQIRNSAEEMVRLNLLRQAIGDAKVPFVVQMAEDILDADEDKKVVIYAVHKAVVNKLSEALKKYGVTTITGEVTQEERSIRQLLFQEKHMPRVMIISSAGGEGIDLYRADTIIFAEREWGPATEEQAEARCHRIGQKNAVEAMYVIAKGTVDDTIDELIDSKRGLLAQVIIQAKVNVGIVDDLMQRIMRGK